MQSNYKQKMHKKMISEHYIKPRGSICLASKLEIEQLTNLAKTDLYDLYRNCSLAVLNAGIVSDDSLELMQKFNDFNIEIINQEQRILLKLTNPPELAFVDDQIILNIQHHLFSVLRDIILNHDLMIQNPQEPKFITDLVFNILRRAKAMEMHENNLDLIVCWGGHSINAQEYEYAKEVGFELGLRLLNVVTGCGSGVMEAPMKGAAVSHAKQRYYNSRFVGITEPSIIASEPPNAIVNELIILPDIEKRLEAFVRLGHGFIIFPGGPGTLEELLYLIGIKLDPKNKNMPLPLILTAPKESADYFKVIDEFIGSTLGQEAQNCYQIIIDDPIKVAQIMKKSMAEIKQFRKAENDNFAFNWSMEIPKSLQQPFNPTHDQVKQLKIDQDQPKDQLVSTLRKVFSAVVSGNIKPKYIEQIKQFGPYEINGDKQIMLQIDKLLKSFVAQDRMKLPSDEPYEACYIISHQ